MKVRLRDQRRRAATPRRAALAGRAALPLQAALPRRAAYPRREERPDLGPIDAVWRLGGEDYLPLRLILVAKLLDLNVARLLAAKSNLSVAEWRVVAQLGVLHDASVREMARQSCIDPAEVSRSVAALEQRRYVQRHANPLDRRSPRFSLTSTGCRAAIMRCAMMWIAQGVPRRARIHAL